MAGNRELFGLNGMSGQIPDAGVILDAQRAAAENAARMAGTTCHYAMAVNRAWLNFWSNHLTQYTEIPKRLADAQSDFVERAFDHYQESIQQLSGMAREVQEEVQEVIRETEETGKRAAKPLRAEAKDFAKGSRPKESRPPSAGEHRRGAH
ncbi:MAG: phasin family protein [Rhodomicrobium sp.]